MKLFIKVILFCAGFWALCFLIAFFARDDYLNHARLTMKDFYQQDKVDYVFVGASHVAHSIHCDTLDALVGGGTKSFCLGTHAQTNEGTLAVTREALDNYKIKCVFVDCDIGGLYNGGEETPLSEWKPSIEQYLVYHYIRGIKNKLIYMTESLPPAYYLNELLPIGKMHILDVDPRYIIKNTKAKLSGDYYKVSNIMLNKWDQYGGKGTILCDNEAVPLFGQTEEYGGGKQGELFLSKNWIKNIDKIVALCKARGVKVVFYSLPCTDYWIKKINIPDSYDECNRELYNFSKKSGCDYYNFNLCKKEYLSLDDTCFYNDSHMNTKGIMAFTNAFAAFLTTDDKNAMFYSSYDEKLSLQESAVLGLQYDKRDNKSLRLFPIINYGSKDLVTLKAFAKTGDKKAIECKVKRCDYDEAGEYSFLIDYPRRTQGVMEVTTFYDGKQCAVIKYEYSAMLE